VKAKTILAIQICAVLVFVFGTAMVANQWRLEGNTQRAKREADGKIERSRMVTDARRNAGILSSRYREEGEKERRVQVASGESSAKAIEAKANTERVRMNNEGNAAIGEVLDVIREKDRRKKNPLDKY
jgi:hypothetical protein